ncbi:MAG: hypothetical protein DHS20C05_19450 [Hyphococcus sp.]|nr:MAG: hypothetical protein DHS20C05_19450 [Marinicaulis sp.]
MNIFKPVALTVMILATMACTQDVSSAEATQSSNAPNTFDAALAEEVGADDYGMRSYVLVILKTGPKDAEITDKEQRGEIFAGHFSNMGKLAEAGKLVLAGPLDGGDKRGLYIFNTASIEEATQIVMTDPAVAAGIFTPEMTKYYGSAALMKINELHQKIQKEKIE